MAVKKRFEPFFLADPTLRYGIPLLSETLYVGTPLVWTSGYLKVPTIESDLNIVGVSAQEMTGDSVKTCAFYQACPGNQFAVQSEDTLAQANVGTIVGLATVTYESDGIDSGDTSTVPVFLIQQVLDMDGDGTIDTAVGEFVDTVLGQDPTT